MNIQLYDTWKHIILNIDTTKRGKKALIGDWYVSDFRMLRNIECSRYLLNWITYGYKHYTNKRIAVSFTRLGKVKSLRMRLDALYDEEKKLTEIKFDNGDSINIYALIVGLRMTKDSAYTNLVDIDKRLFGWELWIEDFNVVNIKRKSRADLYLEKYDIYPM